MDHQAAGCRQREERSVGALTRTDIRRHIVVLTYEVPIGEAMKTNVQTSFWLMLGLLLTIPVWAHHSITAEFDTSKSFTVKGTLTKIEWVNPHAYVYLESKDEKGAVTAYSFETGPPGNLRRAGVLKTMFNVGDMVTIEAYAAKDGTRNLGLVKSFQFADGHAIVLGRDPKEIEEANTGR
jgi:hypothetical protein